MDAKMLLLAWTISAIHLSQSYLLELAWYAIRMSSCAHVRGRIHKHVVIPDMPLTAAGLLCIHAIREEQQHKRNSAELKHWFSSYAPLREGYPRALADPLLVTFWESRHAPQHRLSHESKIE